MRKLIGLSLSIALGLTALVVVPASAGVDRHQIATDSYYITVNAAGVNPRTIIVTTNPCDGTSVFSYGGGFVEEILDTSKVEGGFVYLDMERPNNYFWGGVFPVEGGDFISVYGGGVNSLHAVLTPDPTTYKNHGAYVKAMGGGADAAHSCIGMPVQARP